MFETTYQPQITQESDISLSLCMACLTKRFASLLFFFFGCLLKSVFLQGLAPFWDASHINFKTPQGQTELSSQTETRQHAELSDSNGVSVLSC